MKTTNLDRRLKQHDRLCKMHQYSLQDEMYCSCGRDAAIAELKVLADGMEWLYRAHQYYERNDQISANSEAGAELRDIIERAINERIISTKSRSKQAKG